MAGLPEKIPVDIYKVSAHNFQSVTVPSRWMVLFRHDNRPDSVYVNPTPGCPAFTEAIDYMKIPGENSALMRFPEKCENLSSMTLHIPQLVGLYLGRYCPGCVTECGYRNGMQAS